jgi:hypothetical protein
MKTKGILIQLAFLICLSFISTMTMVGQTDSLKYAVKTTDGNEYIGYILEKNADKVILLTEALGPITLMQSAIKSIKEIKEGQMVNGQYWFENLQSTRHFWSPNGYGLKKGEAYYQNVWIFFNQFSAGITDNISIGVGTMPFFLFGGSSTPVWLLPKVSIPVVKDKLNIGAGALIGTLLGENSGGYGILYGVSTFGHRDGNVSVGIGYGYADGEMADRPIINLSVLKRVSARGYFISENYFISDVTLLSFGGRRLIRSVGLDFGLIIPIANDMDSFVAVPWLGLSVPFGE